MAYSAGFSKNRFNVETGNNLADRLAGLTILAFQGVNVLAEKLMIEKLAPSLSQEEVLGLDEETRTRAFFFAVRLYEKGFKLPVFVWQALVKPPEHSQTAMSWHQLANRTLGLSWEFVPPESGADGEEFIYWKFGRGKHPRDGDWKDIFV